MSSRPRLAISRRKPARAPPDTRRDDADVLKSRRIAITERKRGRDGSQASDYSVSINISENFPISENELRALEILLGAELKELLA